jgi:parallel beta-helix repeat protein
MKRSVCVLAAFGIGFPALASAQIQCGDVIDQTTHLMADILACDHDPAIEVIGPATLKLNGFTISCTSTADPEEDPAGIDAGVLLVGRGAKIIGPGTVKGCHNGVVLEGEGGHTVINMTAMENDDGIEVRSPDNNLINNTTTMNEDEGFDVEDGGNRFVGNQVIDNTDKGLVINIGVGNLILRNLISGSGDDGIEIEEDGSNTKIISNIIESNGERGIELDGGDDNDIVANKVVDNGWALQDQDEPEETQGIRVQEGAENNKIIANKVFGHDEDIFDGNQDCDNNRYAANSFKYANRDCIR